MHPPHPDDLTEILTQTWAMLRRGVRDRKHSFHTPTLATVDEHGCPEARTVVLRGVDEESRALWCHTDARSPKVAHAERQNTVAWHLYDAGTRVQLRLRAKAEILDPAHDERANAAWQRTGPHSRVCYRAPEPPGTPADTPVANLPEPDAAPDTESQAPHDEERGIDRFRVFQTTVIRIDWLRLRHDGHRRARFEWHAGDLVARWIHP